jgi:hypothetical protein
MASDTTRGKRPNDPVLNRAQMRGLLKGYLIDETQGLNVSSAPTINETLREGKMARDRQRVSGTDRRSR